MAVEISTNFPIYSQKVPGRQDHVLGEAAVMAGKLNVLYLALILMSVFASARRPPEVENNDAFFEPAPRIEYASQTDASRSNNVEAFEPAPRSPSEYASQTDVSRGDNVEYGKGVKAEIENGNGRLGGVEKQDDIGKRIINKKIENENGRRGGDEKQDDIQNENGRLKIDSPQPNSATGNGRLKIDSPHPYSGMGVGLIPIIPGADGSFHFTLGPINFGGNIGWAPWGSFSPGYMVSYNQPQPYGVWPYTSPYPSPYAPPLTRYPSPYAPPLATYPSPYVPPTTRYGQGQPAQGYYGPYPSGRNYAPSSASQTGVSAANQHN